MWFIHTEVQQKGEILRNECPALHMYRAENNGYFINNYSGYFQLVYHSFLGSKVTPSNVLSNQTDKKFILNSAIYLLLMD